MGRSLRADDGDGFGFGISLYQAAAVAAPNRPIRELLGLIPALTSSLAQARVERTKMAAEPRSPNSFEDFDELVEQLAKVPPVQLGKPVPNERHLPRRRVGSNPAAHNRALLGDYGPTDERARAAE